MLLLRANTLALGHSGCRPLLVDRICAFLELGIHPVVPEQGSVGASGDLAPLAHLALPLIGRGQVEVARAGHAGARCAPGARPGAAGARAQGGAGAPQRDAADVRARGAPPRGRRPARAHGVGRGRDVRRGAARARRSPTPPRTSWPGRTPARSAVAGELRHLLRGSGPPGGAPRVGAQGPGPVLAALRAAGPRRGPGRLRPPPARARHRAQLRDRQPARVPGRRRRCPTDALATGGGLVITGGNFHGEPIALALDFAKLALAELGRDLRAADGAARGPAAQRRAAGVPDPGSGPEQRADDRPVHGRGPRVGEQGARAPVVAPTRSRRRRNQEDHVSMGAAAARHARTVLGHVQQIVAIELLCAAQALDLRLALLAADGGGAPAPGDGRRRGTRAGPGAGGVPRRRSRARAGPRSRAALVEQGALADSRAERRQPLP